MYSKTEIKALKKRFWEGLGEYAAALPELHHRKRLFMLHHTGLRGTVLKFEAGRDGAAVVLEINDPDTQRRQRLYDHFHAYRIVLEEQFPNGLQWQASYNTESGTTISRIFIGKNGLDIHRQNQWIDFYNFLATEMIKLEKAFRLIKEAWQEEPTMLDTQGQIN